MRTLIKTYVHTQGRAEKELEILCNQYASQLEGQGKEIVSIDIQTVTTKEETRYFGTDIRIEGATIIIVYK